MRKKNAVTRDNMALAAGVSLWEAACGFLSPVDAAQKLGLPLRTYHRYKADGLPNKLQREVILDRMESLLPRRARGQ